RTTRTRCCAGPDGRARAPRPPPSPFAPRSTCPPSGEAPPWSSSHRPGQGGELAPAHPELPVANLILVFVESAGRRAGCARSIFVVHAAVAGAHEEIGLVKPPHGASEVGAVNREELEDDEL